MPSRAWARGVVPPPLRFQPDQLYRVPTDDGSAVALGRYLPRGGRRFGEPVVLAHSLAINRFNLDFDERYSVARALARRGFEAWVLELRGHGLGGSGEGSSFDVEATFDVTAALRAVLSTGTASAAHWVGHSRGGQLAYAHLGRFPQAPIASVVALGSPVGFSALQSLKGFVSALSPALSLEVLPLRLAARAAVPIGLPPDPVGKYLLRAENVEPTVIRQALAHAVADLPGGVARQFARWVGSGRFDGNDGFDYTKGMRAITVPVLSLAGAADLLAPPRSAHEVAGLTSGRVETVTAGVSSGFSADYGHGDLALGRRAPDELVPLVCDFLARHSTEVG